MNGRPTTTVGINDSSVLRKRVSRPLDGPVFESFTPQDWLTRGVQVGEG